MTTPSTPRHPFFDRPVAAEVGATACDTPAPSSSPPHTGSGLQSKKISSQEIEPESLGNEKGQKNSAPEFCLECWDEAREPERKIFQQREVGNALKHAAKGGQALHLMSGRFAYLRKDTPNCFKNREVIAHVFDWNLKRLKQLARRLGVKVIRVERAGTFKQHIDLCGKPLERAMKEFLTP